MTREGTVMAESGTITATGTDVWNAALAGATRGGRDRRLTTTYKGSEVPGSRDDRAAIRVVDLTTRHDRDRKRYEVTAYLITHEGGMVRWEARIYGVGRDTLHTLARIPTERYSSKALAALHSEWVERFQSLPEDDEVRAWAVGWLEGR